MLVHFAHLLVKLRVSSLKLFLIKPIDLIALYLHLLDLQQLLPSLELLIEVLLLIRLVFGHLYL